MSDVLPARTMAQDLRSPRFLIISEPRTGSNNVAYVLDAHPALEVGNELLHPVNGVKREDFPELDLPWPLPGELAREPERPGKREYHWLASLTAEQRYDVCHELFTKYNGFKIHNQHLPAEIIREIAQDFDCSVIVTTRVDLFGQVLSNFIAEQVGRWHADDHARGSQEPFAVRPQRMVNWLNDMTRARTDLWTALRPCAERVFVCQYEVFFSGDQTERIGRFLVLLDFLGVTRFGKLAPAEMEAAFKKVLHYVDPGKQKMNDAQSAQRRITNYAELQARYEVWTMASYR